MLEKETMMITKRHITAFIRTIRRERKVNSKIINNFILGVIFINAIVLGLETIEGLSNQLLSFLRIIDKLCLCIFIIELGTKLLVQRLKFFKNSWNIFDFIIITLSCFPANSGLPILRSLRILRVFLFISFIPQLRIIVQSLLISLPGIFGITILLIIVFYVFGVIATKTFYAASPDDFGNLGKSLLSLFQIMTLDNWSQIFNRVTRNNSYATYAYVFFIPFILLSSYIILNIFIAIIINGMRNARTNLERKLIHAELRMQRSKDMDKERIINDKLSDTVEALCQHMIQLENKIDEMNKKMNEK